MNIRRGSFLPDCSRSGRFVEGPSMQDACGDLGDLLDQAARPWKPTRSRPTKSDQTAGLGDETFFLSS